jgi:hypothetical protein
MQNSSTDVSDNNVQVDKWWMWIWNEVMDGYIPLKMLAQIINN